MKQTEFDALLESVCAEARKKALDAVSQELGRFAKSTLSSGDVKGQAFASIISAYESSAEISVRAAASLLVKSGAIRIEP